MIKMIAGETFTSATGDYKIVFQDGPLSCSVAGGTNYLIKYKDGTSETVFFPPGFFAERIGGYNITNTTKEYVCHSGGCPGADMMWENEGLKYGVKTISYSFHNHKQEGRNQKILTRDELEEGYAAARVADRTLKRNFDNIQYPYVKNLLARNWFQVKNADCIFAIAKKFVSDTIVDGGTGWAVQMAIDNKKDVYVYDQSNSYSLWWMYHYVDYSIYNPEFIQTNKFIPLLGKITLTNSFAGIGTRDLTDGGKNAIVEVYKNTFEK